jgi:hypothetical protein
MTRHVFCLTVDADPDGTTSRAQQQPQVEFRGLQQAAQLPERLEVLGQELGCTIPITWFVRLDGEIEKQFGSPSYLLEQHAAFWSACLRRGDELGWHPHFPGNASAESPLERTLASGLSLGDEWMRLWRIARERISEPKSFRNGEAWHSPSTYAVVEHLGLECDSTVIPGRANADQRWSNWGSAPNHPYFPAPDDLCQEGPKRQLLEVPMNGWLTQAGYDRQPRVRYMNPAVHQDIFQAALKSWSEHLRRVSNGLHVWTLVLHPDEFMPATVADSLYARSLEVVCGNLLQLAEAVMALGHGMEFLTLTTAARGWRGQLKLPGNASSTVNGKAGLPPDFDHADNFADMIG